MEDSNSQLTALSLRSARILVVEDDDALRCAVVLALKQICDDVSEESDGAKALVRIADRSQPNFDLVLSDLRMPGADGLAVQRATRDRDPRTAFILMTAYASIDVAVCAMREGARDFIQKPFDLAQLEIRIARALEYNQLTCEVAQLRDRVESQSRDIEIVADSASMREAIATAKQVAETRSTVLLSGETGTGKEVIAGLIHAHSARAASPFIKVNCAALPETLLESELFGHERGAFTGADHVRIGRFEQASSGTLLLDEIVETSPTIQAKLLRVLQDQEFYRLGGTRPIKTHARIIAATNRDLRRALSEGLLREDLYYRINVIEIHLAPLRERVEDIGPMAQHYLERFARDLGRPCVDFSDSAMATLRAHRWPGNVRELSNVIERAVLMSRESRIDAGNIQLSDAATPGGRRWFLEMPPEGLSLETVERELVLAALRRSGFVQKDAAELIGVSRRKLNYMIQRMGLTHPSWRKNRGGETGDCEEAQGSNWSPGSAEKTSLDGGDRGGKAG